MMAGPNLPLRSSQPALRGSQFGILLLLLLALGFLVRLAPLGRYVTPDEPAWVHRSILFSDALAARQWLAVPSTGHPGVTTMWLGAAGVVARRWLDPAASAAHLDWIRRLAWLAPENGAAFRYLAFFLPAGRVAVALVTTLGLVAVCGLTSRLFGRRVALLATGLMAFDPFLVGHSGLLHTDGLLATFVMLSVLCLLNAVREEPRAGAWSLAGGAAAGLALLTKSLGAFLLPFAALVLALAWLARGMRLGKALALLLLWILACGGVFVALYPAMWVAPLQTLRDLFVAPAYHATTALMPTFFAGRTALYHGPAFYVVALPFRLSPIVLVGLGLSVRTFVKVKSRRLELARLWLFALGYILLLALNVKKYDRYLLPVFPVLALAAALSLSRVRGPRWSLGLLVPLLALQLLFLLPFAPAPLFSYNPLLGGPWVAERVLPVGWGEEMGAAARWLNGLPEAEQLTVAVPNVPSFASIFVGHTVPLRDTTIPLADYTVPLASSHPEPFSRFSIAHSVTLGFLQRVTVLTHTAALEQAAYLSSRAGPDDLILLDADTPLLRRYEGPGEVRSAASLPDEPAVAAWLEQQAAGRPVLWLVASPAASAVTARHLRWQVDVLATPVESATVASATITRYVIRTPQSAAPASQTPPSRALFGDHLTLVDGALPTSVARPDSLSLTLRWRARSVPSTDYRVALALRDGGGRAWSAVDRPILNEFTFPTSAWEAGEWSDARYKFELPPGIPPAVYTVEASLYDAATGAGLGAVGAGGGFLGTRVVLGEVTVAPPAAPAALEPPERLDLAAGPLSLLGLEPPPAQVRSGDRWPLALTWRADAPPSGDYSVLLRLVDPAGEVALEVTAPLSPYPTSHWRAGDGFESRYDLHVLPGVPAGRYRLNLNVLDAAGAPLWATGQAVAEVEVLPRQRSFTLPEALPYPLDVAWAEGIRLRGFGLAQVEVAPGGALPLTLTWKAEGPAERDYTLFVHLLGPDGRLHGQVDRVHYESPPSSWAAGQVIVDELALPVSADAPPGLYRVAVGFYDAAYGDRLPVVDDAGASFADDRVVLPVEISVTGGPP
jgi:4-amino-4-deoxy-L-arabinose transferase-like glycosyltransferase